MMWWFLTGFIVGGFCGVAVMCLMIMAAEGVYGEDKECRHNTMKDA